MNTDLRWIVAVAVLSAFVMLHAEAIGQWIEKKLARVDSLKRTAGRTGSTAATDRKFRRSFGALDPNAINSGWTRSMPPD
jgi:hypothetical protein